MENVYWKLSKQKLNFGLRLLDFFISIRIVMKTCIRSSYRFWSSVGFVGDINADILLKTIKIS